MSSADIILFIDSIPKYIQFLYPGYIVIYLYDYFAGYTIEDSKNTLVKSIAISYFFNVVLNVWNLNIVLNNCILVLLSVFTAYISYRFIRSGIFGKIGDVLGINTNPKTSDLGCLLDENKKPVYLRVFLRDKPVAYEGFLIEFESEGEFNNRYLILSQYQEYVIQENYTEKKIPSKNYFGTSEEKVLLFYHSISRIEKCALKRILEEKTSGEKPVK